MIGTEEAIKTKIVRSLVRGVQRYHYASLQDKNVIVAARHNAYAVALVDALRDVATEAEVFAIAKVSVKKLQDEIKAFQDKLEGKAFEVLEMMRAKGIELPF